MIIEVKNIRDWIAINGYNNPDIDIILAPYETEKKELSRLKKQAKEIDKKVKEARKLEVQQESGKLSIADNQGGELSLVDNGGLSIIGERK